MAISNKSPVGLGHNKPPIAEILSEQNADALAELEQLAGRANEMPRTIKSDDDLPPLVAIVKEARSMARALDKSRKEETRPLRDRITDTNAFFNAHVQRAERIQSAAEKIINDYQRKKAEAERQQRLREEKKARAEAEKKLQKASQAPLGSAGEIAMKEAEDAAGAAARATSAAHASASDLARAKTEYGTASVREIWDFEIIDPAQVPLEKLRPFLGIEAIKKSIRQYLNFAKDTANLEGVRFFKSTKTIIR